MTLRLRLVLSYSLTATLTVALVLILGFFIVRRQLLNGTDFLLEAEFREIEPKLAMTAPINAETINRALKDHVTIDASFYFFQVHNARGTVLFRSPNLGEKVLPDLSLAKPGCHSVKLNGLTLRVGEYHAGKLHVQIATRLDYLSNLAKRFGQDIAFAIPAVLLFSGLVGSWLGELFLKPIRSIEQTARRISISNLKERIAVRESKDEIARLSILLNEMFDRLEKSFEQIKQVTADLSHELRTPLSIVALHAEKLLKRSTDPDARASLKEVLEEAKRLNLIIDQILVLAKAEAQSLPLKIETRSTKGFIEEFAEDASVLADAAGKTFILERNESTIAEFDESWIRQVLFNLVSNSIKFSAPNSSIHFQSFGDKDYWQMILTDHGPGIPPEQRTAVFQRFTQLGDGAQSRQGAGLGLAVCKSILELHRGEIVLDAPEHFSGLRVRIRLPAKTLRP